MKLKCKFCGTEDSKKFNKKGRMGERCMACAKSYVRFKNKVRYVDYKGGKCVACGYSKSYDALEFHHKDPSQKSFVISKIMNYGKDKQNIVYEELDKCILLCSGCHAEKHDMADRKSKYLNQIAIDNNRDAALEQRVENRKERTCDMCANTFNATTDTQRYCSSKCLSKSQEKITWPSNEELKRLVWEKPMTKLSRDLGVSDRAIKKRCERRGINTPPGGYWARSDSVKNKT